MVPLRIRSSVIGRQDRFVVRLNNEVVSDSESLASSTAPLEAYLGYSANDGAIFSFGDGSISLFDVSASELDGDVLLVDPRGQTAHRLIRAKSRHNTLLITEQCDQLCIMCSQPPKKTHDDVFGYLSAAVKLAPQGSTIGLSGGEPTLHKEALFAFLAEAHRCRPDIRFHILTNGQHFYEADLDSLRQSASHGVVWGIPLYAAEARLHDLIVRKPGAFERLLSSFSVMMRAGASVELRTVVMQQTIEGLPRLSRFVSTHLGMISTWAIMQLENAGYARTGWKGLFFDSSSDFRSLSEAIDIATVRGVSVMLYNFPLCTVPKSYREHAVQSISDWKQKYLPACEGCSAHDACGGFFEWYEPDVGFRGVSAI